MMAIESEMLVPCSVTLDMLKTDTNMVDTTLRRSGISGKDWTFSKKHQICLRRFSCPKNDAVLHARN